MLKYLSPVDAYLWLATAFFRIVVAVVVLRSGLGRRGAYPAFALYAWFTAFAHPIMMALPSKFYVVGYVIGTTTTHFLLAAALFELSMHVCGPRISLPSWVPREMGSWAGVAAAVSAAVTVAVFSVRLPVRTALVAATQGGMMMTLFLTLVVLLAYSKYLGMEWQARPRQIVTGLAIYLSVNAVALFTLGHVPREFMRAVDRCGSIALLFSLLWWTFTLRRREPAPEPVTQEMIDTILAFHQETIEAAEAVGLAQPVK